MLAELAYLGFILVRGWRWQVILQASAPGATFGDATAVTAIGFAVNSVSPFKLGELLRIGAIAPRVQIGIGEAGATVVVERVLDVLALLVIAVGAAAVSGGSSNSLGLWSGVLVIGVVSVAIGAVAYLMVTHPEATLAIIERVATRLPARVATFVDTFAASVLKGFASLRSPRRLAAAGALSVLIWLCIVAGLVAFFRALTPELSLSTLVLACALFVVSADRALDLRVRLKYAQVPADRIEVVGDWRDALQRAARATPEGEMLFILPTYTAMLELRAVLTRDGVLEPYWQGRSVEAEPQGADGAGAEQRGDVADVTQNGDRRHQRRGSRSEGAEHE